jgi:hypothetical protein
MKLARKFSQGVGYVLFTPVVIFVMLMAILLFIAVYKEPNDG